MTLRDPRSIIIIFFYLALNGAIIWFSFSLVPREDDAKAQAKSLAPEYTTIDDLDYFIIEGGFPKMSLSATHMNSQGETFAEFNDPTGIYNHRDTNEKKSSKNSETIRYKAKKGIYRKGNDSVLLTKNVELQSSDSTYSGDRIEFFMKNDLINGDGNVKFTGEDLKSKDVVVIESDTMTAKPKQKFGHFVGNVRGSLTRKRKYEGKIDFKSKTMDLDGIQSLAHLEGDVWMKRGDRQVTSGKADIYLENYNKSLKYFVLNDDVKVTEKLSTPNGITERRSFSERLEGFGQEQKMVLSGAPRVETGADVIKGYRITIRENTDLIEVDDAMSDMKVKREEKKNN
jgi:lipopolysaccharide export system protein LptA